ncbi:MAG: hypothetical protein ACTSRU_01770 [Candidatus Hodarchaeales archaeon]
MRSVVRGYNYLVFDPKSDLLVMKRIIIHKTTCSYVQNRHPDDKRYMEFADHRNAEEHSKFLSDKTGQMVVKCARCQPWFPI